MGTESRGDEAKRTGVDEKVWHVKPDLCSRISKLQLSLVNKMLSRFAGVPQVWCTCELFNHLCCEVLDHSILSRV